MQFIYLPSALMLKQETNQILVWKSSCKWCTVTRNYVSDGIKRLKSIKKYEDLKTQRISINCRGDEVNIVYVHKKWYYNVYYVFDALCCYKVIHIAMLFVIWQKLWVFYNEDVKIDSRNSVYSIINISKVFDMQINEIYFPCSRYRWNPLHFQFKNEQAITGVG